MSTKSPLQRSSVARITQILRLKNREIATVILLTLLYGIFEGVGVSLLLPVLQFINEGAAALNSSSPIWKALLQFADTVGIPVTLSSLLLLAFVPILLRQVVFFANAWYSAILQRRASQRLRIEGFSSFVDADLSFAVTEGQGTMISLLTQQINRGSSAMLQFTQLLGALVLITVYIVILLLLQARLALLAAIAMLVISWIVQTTIRRSREYGRQVSLKGNETFAMIGERVGAMRLIKMRGQERSETRHIAKVSLDFEQAQVKIAMLNAGVQVIIDPLLMLAVFVVVYLGVEQLGLDLASLGVFLFVLLRLNTQSKAFNVSRQLLASYLDSLEMVVGAIGRANRSRKVVVGERAFKGLQEEIRLDRVSFAYEDDTGEFTEVLNDVSLTIPKGSLVAFVGRSGAGKSTLVDLLPHLRQVTSGRILYDGIPVEEFSLRSLRRRIGFMTQDASMFNDTIRYNLEYGLERAPSEEEIRSALEAAHCTPFVAEMPKGLDTVIGDRGVRLSGGQRQRLALARVLLENPDILILDEPTSALDSESEQYIQQALDLICETKTLIVIAHRMSTVQRADCIYVIEDGRIAEQGTHQELLAHEGAYRRLFDLQLNA